MHVIALALLAACRGPGPQVADVDPPLLCDAAGPVEVTVTGEGFTVGVTDALEETPTLHPPTIRLVPRSGLVADTPSDAGEVRAVSRWTDTGRLGFTVDADLGLAGATWDVVVENADGHEGRFDDALTVVGVPWLDGTDRPAACRSAQGTVLTLSGEGLLVIDGEVPRVEVRGRAATVLDVRDCAPLSGRTDGLVCRTVEVEVDTLALPLGPAAVTLTNPAPAACAAPVAATLEIRSPPTVSAVDPPARCQGGGTVTVSGVGFVDGMSARVGGSPAGVTFVDSRTLEVALPGGLGLGLHDLSVFAPYGCGAVLPDAVRITAAPLVAFVDPPIVYSGVSVEATAYLTAVVGEITDAWLEHPDTGAPLAVAWSWDPAAPDLVTVRIPDGLDDGTWTVRVREDGTCTGWISGSVTVSSDLSVAVDAVDPPFAWRFDHTGVDVLGADPPPAGQVSFQETPRVYLVGADGVATPLSSTTFRAADRLTAVIPHGVTPGHYDVLVVNPDATIGLLEDGLEVTLGAPPFIEVVGPATLPNSDDAEVLISGRDFRDPSVQVECLEGDQVTTRDAPVAAWSHRQIAAIVPATAYLRAVCVVRVTNGDGPWARWSAISITNPAQNLSPWETGTDMVEARRAPAGAAGRTTPVSRFVYAIGGDDGAIDGAKASIEAAPIDAYGRMGDWALLDRPLPAPRTLAVASVLGQFVYLVGGNDGDGPVDTVWRARILDPLDVPHFEGLAIWSGTEGLGGGTWTWRVAALFPGSDPVNPNGESLASEPFSITLPEVSTPLVPVLSWSPVAGAVGYRVYRGGEWVTDVTVTKFIDRGDPADASRAPQSEGALGSWKALPRLSVPRESPCIAMAPDPFPDPELQYLYVAGGRSEAVIHDTIEYLDLLVASDGMHVPGAWTTSARRLGVPRYRCGGFGLDPRLHTALDPGESWVYFAGGMTDRNATGQVEAGRVSAGGELQPWSVIRQMSPARAGFGFAAASNFLYGFGGHHGNPSKTSVSAQLEPLLIPDVANWNSLAIGLIDQRVLPGSAQESAVIFVLGGTTSDVEATRSTERTSF